MHKDKISSHQPTWQSLVTVWSIIIIYLVEDEDEDEAEAAAAAFIWHCYIPAVEKLRVKQLKNYICA